ncbi:hypothetical protein [Billgrantia gudaonensis]|uniref:Uncharacterized protein n=1 Tax=Billgrantia gudaonensis TaxID=376427 RepID=A0A1G8QAV2_9GAMM|nr:hypothetical protein [Halomonas gudaonensis]SDJ01706.1 hypothetical protein SAMN04487954_102349 [Halomonas gudaonensis]
MHRHVEWDDPGADSVLSHFEHDPTGYSEPGPGDILSARYRGRVVRIRVDAYVDGTSIGEVAAIIAPASGERQESVDKLHRGDTVRLPDDKRAFEPGPANDSADDEDP